MTLLESSGMPLHRNPISARPLRTRALWLLQLRCVSGVGGRTEMSIKENFNGTHLGPLLTYIRVRQQAVCSWSISSVEWHLDCESGLVGQRTCPWTSPPFPTRTC